MGRCSIEKLGDIHTALQEIRKWPWIIEPKPGIFYLKRDPFLHFHETGLLRWADLKVEGEFQPVDLPYGLTAKQAAFFLRTVERQYKVMTESCR